LFLFFLLLFHSKVEERIWKNWPVSKLKRRPINATTTRIPMRERIPSVQDPNSWFLTISRSRKNLDKISFYSPRKEKRNFPIFVSPNNCQHGINQLRRLIPPPTRLSEIPGPVVVLQYLQGRDLIRL
jgi:hypothetical protein